ncbi:MAG: hypothetical protein FWD27_06115 [Coriobacteriia bacterium]|nr:hypothetical protein [Coriobacteriia bacterium]
MNKGPFIAKDGGFTTVGVAVALMLVVALLFSAAQVKWVQSHSADIQYVADAGALAGGNVVGEYLVVARIADAVILSLSILGMATYGIAIVVSCIPYAQSVGAELMQFGTKVFKARDTCARTAATALNKLQAALPFLIAIKAAAAIEANACISGTTSYYRGLALPLPLQGEDSSFPNVDAAAQSNQELSEQNTKTSEYTDAAQQAHDRMNQAKMNAYLADCGNNPSYCMYERAGWLAKLSGSQNPYFSSVDTWLFDYAYARAEAYYAKRLAIEAPANQALDELIRSFCRERLYSYAVEELKTGWCNTLPNGTLSASFPLLPTNTAQMMQTRLYTEQVYPVCSNGALHGHRACPAYQDAGGGGVGSVAALDAGSYVYCATCGFRASTIGRVASASSHINNGFEYHYRIAAEEAGRYQAASEDYNRETKAAEDSARESFDIFEEAMKALKTKRLKPQPPGRNGVIAIVVDMQSHSIPAGFSNPAVSTDAQVKPRVAISAAALAEEKAEYGANILASFLDKAKAEAEQSSFALGALGVFDGILDIWGSALLVYSRGGDAISEGLVAFLDSIPLVKSTPLSRWAKTALDETIKALGLEGADLDTPRPLLVNSMHVLRTSDAAPVVALRSAKEMYSGLAGSGSTTLGGALIEGLTGMLADKGTELLESEFTLYEISFGDASGLPRIPITLRLPDNMAEQGRTAIDNLAGSTNALLGGGGSNAVWR